MTGASRHAPGHRPGALVQRIVLAVAGGYGLTVAVTMVLARLLSGVVERMDAVVTAALLAFLVYLLVLLWAFAEPRLARLWAVLGGGGALGAALVYAPGMA